MNTYTIKIEKLIIDKSNLAFQNCVSKVHAFVHACDTNGNMVSSSVQFIIKLPTSSQNFITYDKLTEDIVTKWIRTGSQWQSVINELDDQLTKIKDQATADLLPWQLPLEVPAPITVSDETLLNNSRTTLLYKLRAWRSGQELAGVEFEGRRIPCNNETQTALSVVAYSIQNQFISKSSWKVKNGEFIELSSSNIKQLQQLLSQTQQYLFNVEHQFSQLILAASTIEELNAIEFK